MAPRKKPRKSGADHPSGEREASPHASWRIRYTEAILGEDLPRIGHAALQLARNAIEKKLKIDPEQYGAALRSPLQGLFKLKTSHVRIAYHVDRPAREVWILMIGDRREIWDEDQDTILERLGIVKEQTTQAQPHTAAGRRGTQEKSPDQEGARNKPRRR